LDVINVQLPVDPAQNKVIPTPGFKYNYIDYAIIKPTRLGNPNYVRPFITSYGAEGSPFFLPSEVYLNLELKLSNSVTRVPGYGSNYIHCGTQTLLYDSNG
jgi:hypothetical protein